MALLMVSQDEPSFEEVGQRLGIKTHSARRMVERAMEYPLEAIQQDQRLADANTDLAERVRNYRELL